MSEASPVLFYLDNDPCYFLSNFYPWVQGGRGWKPLSIVYEDETYPTSEHVYQMLKYKHETPDELAWRQLIRTASTPTIAKYLGHQYTHVKWGWQRKLKTVVETYKPLVRRIDDFENSLPTIMEVAVRAKFEDEDLMLALLDTHPSVLGENSSETERFRRNSHEGERRSFRGRWAYRLWRPSLLGGIRTRGQAVLSDR